MPIGPGDHLAGAVLNLDDVFVTGGEPTVTYVSRDEAGIEQTVNRYLRTGNKVLAISGPSKSGKSVLARRVLAQTATQYVPMTGASIDSMASFWSIIAHRIGVHSEIDVSKEAWDEGAGSVSGRVGGGVVPAELSSQVTGRLGEKQGRRTSATVVLSESVKDKLVRDQICLVIDDFHYASESVRTNLAREIKDLIFSGVRVILIAVPDRVLDLLQSEVELTGRVTRLKVTEWESIELLRIATQGHEALNVVDRGGSIAATLVERSFGSPLLMQELCGEHCQRNEIWETVQGAPQELNPPVDWTAFFREVSANLRPVLVDALQVGPVQRRRRKQVPLKDGGTVDMYSAVLIALGRAAPKRRLELGELSDEMAAILKERPPLEKIRRTCRKMADIARDKRGEGDAAFDFSESPERVTIADPYLAFYLGAGGLREFQLPSFAVKIFTNVASSFTTALPLATWNTFNPGDIVTYSVHGYTLPPDPDPESL